MRKFFNKLNRNQKGFTLVELMIVVIIIGILVAIAIPVYNSTQKKAKETACEANIRVIQSAILQAQLEEESPKSLDDIVKYLDGRELPKCPLGGTYSLDTDDNGNYVVSCDHKK